MINRQNNVYTVCYAALLVIVVGLALSLIYQALRPMQQENIANDTRRQILAAALISPDEQHPVSLLYKEHIKDSFIVDANGQRVDSGMDPFDVNVAEQSKVAPDKRILPVFLCSTDHGDKYILPVYGAGLWGPIWGYVAFDSNGETIYGAYFAHQGETPGLGAEIEKPAFSSQFEGKNVFNDLCRIPPPSRRRHGARQYKMTLRLPIMKIPKSLLPLFNPLSAENPVIVQILGICSALAVTAKLEPAVVMTISVTAVLAFANVIISCMRKTIPTSIRIIVQLVVVAALVVIVDQVLKAYTYDVS